MANTSVPQVLQIRNSFSYIDTRLPSLANYETNATDLQYDVNSLRSALNNFLNRDGTGFPGAGNDWWDDLVAPTIFSTDAGASDQVRGINATNNDLWGIQRKRILKRVSMINVDVPDPVNAQVAILALADIPSEDISAVDLALTTGTVVAEATAFLTASASDTVLGANLLQPKNLMILTDVATGEPVSGVISGQQIYGLLQSEFSVNATVITGTTPNRVQVSFVKHDAGSNTLELAPVGDMNGIVFNYAYVKRDAFEDCPEEAWLSAGFADSGVANATRQAGYDNQGTGIVTLGTSATLKLDEPGIIWSITDDADASVFALTEGESGGTTAFAIGAAVDTYTNAAVTNVFTNGIQVDSSNPIHIGNATSGTDTILFGGTAATVTTDSNNLTVSTTGSGGVLVSSVGLVDIQAATAVSIDSSGSSISIGGDANTGAVNLGTAGARAVTLGNVTAGTTTVINSGSAGVDLSAPSALNELLTLTNTGTDAYAVEMFVNDTATNPDSVGVDAPVGSVMWKDFNATGVGQAWLKVGTGITEWEQVQTGADANTLSEVVTNQAGTAFLSGAFTTAWGIADTRAVNFTDDGGTVLLGISSAPDGIVSTVATFDVNASGLISLDSTAGGITLDAATAIAIDSGTGDIANSTALSAVANTGDFSILTGAVTAGAFNAGDMDVILGSAVSGAGGGFALLAGAATVGTGGGFAVVAGGVTTGTGGSFTAVTGGASDATGFAGDYSIATGSGAGRKGSYDATFASYLVDVANDDANTGTVVLDSTKLLFGHGDGSTPLEEGDAHVILNAQWTADAETTGGLISVRSRGAAAATTLIATGTNGAGAESSVTNGNLNPLVYVTLGDGSNFSVGEFVLLAGMNLEANNGLYEIASIAAGAAGETDEVTLRGVGSGTDTVREWDSRQLVTDTTVAGSMTNVNICVFRCSNGTWFVADDENADDMTFFGVNSGGVNLDGAYVGGNTATVTDADGSFTLSNTSTSITTTDMFTVTNSPSVATTGDAVVIAHVPGASSSGDTVNISTGANVTGTSFFLDNLGTGSAFTVQDGSTDVVDVSAAGLVKFTPTSGESFLVDTLGAGSVSLDAASSSNFTVDGSTAGTLTNSFLATNSDGTAASAAQLDLIANQDSAAATAVVSTVNLQAVNDGTAAAASSTVNIQATSSGAGANATTADINIRSTGTSSGVVNTVNVQDTATGSVNVATGAFANDVTLGDTTGTSSFAFNAGSGNITGVASSAVVAGSVAADITATNTDNTAASSADVTFTADASGGSAAVVSNITVDAVVGNATGTATGNFMNDGTNAGITVANIASGNSAASNTVNIASPSTGGTSTVNIASTGTGPATVDIGNTGSTSDITLYSGATTAAADSTGWVLTMPTKCVVQTPNLDADGATNAGVIVNEATYTSFENGSLNGSLVIGRNTGYTAAAGVATYEVTVVSCNATTDTITAFTNNGAATDPTATLTTGGTQAAGNFVLVTGSISRENDGIYQVVTDAANVLTLEAVPGADAGFVKNQVSTTVGDSATVCNVTLSVMRVSAAGEWQIFENANTVASIVYQDFGSTATTLSGSVANVGSSPATMSATFDWRITDTESLTFSTAAASNETLLSLAPADGADQIVIGNTVAGTDVDVNAGGAVTIDAGATSNFTVDSANLTLSTTTSGFVDVTAAGLLNLTSGALMDVNAGANLDIDVTGTYDMLSSGTFTIAGTGNSSLDVTSGDLDLTTTTTGDIGLTTATNTTVAGSGGDVAVTTGASAAATGGGIGGAFSVITGGGADGTAQAGPIAAGAGGDGGATLGAGGAATGDGTVAFGSDGALGGSWAVTAGVGGEGSMGVGVGLAGAGGNYTGTGGIGGAGEGGAAALDIAADGGDGGTASTTGGQGGSADIGADSLAAAGDGGDSIGTGGVGGAAVAGVAAGNGGNAVNIGGAPGAIGAGTAGTAGFVVSRTSSDSAVTGNSPIHQMDNNGGGANAGASFSIYGADKTSVVGGIDPAFTAEAGSLYVNRYTGAESDIWFNAASTQADADAWKRVVTSIAVSPRQFAQVVLTRAIVGDGTEVNSAVGTDLRQVDCTGTLPTRATGHDFDTQSEIYFNGVLMMNGSGNDIQVAAMGDTDVDIWLGAGAALAVDDIVTVTYYNI